MLNRILFFLVTCIGICEASSVRLLNDSPYDLRATIRSNNGEYLGSKEVYVGQTVTWEDIYDVTDPNQTDRSQLRPMNRYQEGYTRTPFSVTWSILDSNENFSICRRVHTGAYVTAQGCQGFGTRPEPEEEE